MQKQTKDQKHYRKLKEDGQKDFRKVERENSPYPVIRVTKNRSPFELVRKPQIGSKPWLIKQRWLSGKWSAGSSSKDSRESSQLDGGTTVICRLVGTSGIGHWSTEPAITLSLANNKQKMSIWIIVLRLYGSYLRRDKCGFRISQDQDKIATPCIHLESCRTESWQNISHECIACYN